MENIKVDETMLLRYFSGETHPEENRVVHQWLNESEENQHIAEQIYYIKYTGDTIHAMRSVNTRSDLDRVWKKIKRRDRSRILLRLQRIAAILCLVFLPAIAYLLTNDMRIARLAGVAMNVPEGSISSIILPDGSKVWVNAGSNISYDRNYGIKNRKLKLTGEAFFDVRTNSGLPLEVETGILTIRAKGTQFNVKAYPEDNLTQMLLTEGVIEISAPGQKDIMLQPGQMAVFNKAENNLSVEAEVKTILYTSWKDRRWLIEGTPLGELAPALQRRYAVKVVFDDDILKTYKFRGEIQNQTIEQVSKALQLTAPMNYEMRSDTVFFRLDVKRKKEYDRIVK